MLYVEHTDARLPGTVLCGQCASDVMDASGPKNVKLSQIHSEHNCQNCGKPDPPARIKARTDH